MFGKAITQLFHDVDWGDTDICIVDLPPGTGDAQLSLAQMVKLDGAVMVTTPQEVALADVRRAINMFRKVEVPLLGIVENMDGFTTPDGSKVDIFGSGGGQALSEQYEVPYLGGIPIDISIREGGDAGCPAVLNAGQPAAEVFNAVASELVRTLTQVAESDVPILNIVN
jgi:ATP-binding protein involved in chromosome partitioning